MLQQFAAAYTGNVKKWEIFAQSRVFLSVQSSVIFLSSFLSSDELFIHNKAKVKIAHRSKIVTKSENWNLFTTIYHQQSLISPYLYW